MRPVTARPKRPSHPPVNAGEVIRWVEQGWIAPGEAFELLIRFDHGERPVGGPRPLSRDGSEPPAGFPSGRPGSDQAPADEVKRNRAARIADVMKELNALVGLRPVKALVCELMALVEIQARRLQEGLKSDSVVLHTVMNGNPGTGKTTVARILGRLYKEMGILPKGHLVEVERADLVGEYIGHTAQRTRDHVKKALGGVLFIDEAYSLVRGGEKDFGREAIDTLVKSMEDHRNELLLIMAGYPQEMEWFIESNPGLASRFPIHMTFPDYSLQDLRMIADVICHDRQYRLTPEAGSLLSARLAFETAADNFGNARTVRNILETAMRRQALRLVKRPYLTRDDLMTLIPDDLIDPPEGGGSDAS